MPSIVDHLLAFALIVALPTYATVTYRTFVRKVSTDPGVRVREYWSTVRLQWVLVVVTLALWAMAGRAASTLGLWLPMTIRSAAGLVITALVLGLLAAQAKMIGRLDENGREKLRAQLGRASPLLPTTDAEHRVFRALAVTAGICEEILFRGYLIWYLGSFIHPWLAMAVSAIVFGLGHLYQGKSGVVKTGVVGLLMGALYLGTGSLVWPMIIHAAVDLQGGAVGRAVLENAPSFPRREEAAT